MGNGDVGTTTATTIGFAIFVQKFSLEERVDFTDISLQYKPKIL